MTNSNQYIGSDTKMAHIEKVFCESRRTWINYASALAYLFASMSASSPAQANGGAGGAATGPSLNAGGWVAEAWRAAVETWVAVAVAVRGVVTADRGRSVPGAQVERLPVPTGNPAAMGW